MAKALNITPNRMSGVRLQSLNIVTKILAIESDHLRDCQRSCVYAAIVDAPLIRVRAGLVEAFDAALAAEQVLGRAGVEFIDGQIIRAGYDLEILMGNENMLKSGLGTHGAITVCHGELRGGGEFKAHIPAMAAAFMYDLFSHVIFLSYFPVNRFKSVFVLTLLFAKDSMNAELKGMEFPT